MDLGAYARISELEGIAKRNGIEVTRLRGYRLMSEEEPITQEEIRQMLKDAEISAVEQLVESRPIWCYNSGVSVLSDETDSWKRYYLVLANVDDCKQFVKVRWDRIHGRKRKELKFAIKQERKRILAQWNMWNKYAGRKDVLYIHARLGSWCWYPEGRNKVKEQKWFLDIADDSFDPSYCDIYAKIEKE